jgi:hypothetical protein
MMVDEDVPVDEVLKQLNQNAKDKPKDAHAQYLLGRVHSLAWAMGGNQVRLIPGNGKDKLPDFPAYASVRVFRSSPKPADEVAMKHLDQSIDAYRKAVELDPKNGLYRLGLAWMLEQKLGTNVQQQPGQLQGVEPHMIDPQLVAVDAPKPATQPADRSKQLKEVIDHYVAAFDLRLEHDIKTNVRLLAGDAFISAEAAQNAIRLIKSTDKPDEKLIARLLEGHDKVMSQPIAITPVIVALHPRDTLADLINNDAKVAFDLAGMGTEHKWPWVSARAGVLVWDPKQTGIITSGRQLFGNMTWQMLFQDGYEALATLDKDRDGMLAGNELNGVGLWIDRNENAVSDAGEVVSATRAGIKSIAVKAKADSTGTLHIESGVIWTDGKSTHSYDWVPESK